MKKVLYLGTDRNFSRANAEVVFYPVIKLVPRNIQEQEIEALLKRINDFTHCFLTSKNAVTILFAMFEEQGINLAAVLQDKCVSIGPATSEALKQKEITALWEPEVSSQEGLIAEMRKRDLRAMSIFYPRSSAARTVFSNYLDLEGIAYEAFDLYDTVYQIPGPLPDLTEIEEIVFTSPSTVKGFFLIRSEIPEGKKCTFQGSITEEAFRERFNKSVTKI